MGYKIYINGNFYSEYKETSHGYNMAKSEFNNLKRIHKKDCARITLCGLFGDILEDTKK